ncbi:hypothetical protein LAYK6_18380 [Lactobacillus amylovorus subsp. amylovorus]|nr:hypothetical protein LAYK6_18380 [Lactobacillus amylovorus]
MLKWSTNTKARSYDELHQLALKIEKKEFVDQLKLNEIPLGLFQTVLERWPKGIYDLPLIEKLPYIDPGRSQSGDKDSRLGITKHGNHIARKILYRVITQMETVRATQPCHITDYYDKKKQSSHSPGYKKIAIASVHKLIRTLFALIKHNQLYDYNIATKNQRL